ncbi:hypothetical protein BSKO_06347 [Bryopsis sp. KO-2023]|nr:hypothetical protein BSKO_06347 [Bryopsis sp. KO-2023]
MDNPFSALESLCEVAAAVSAGASTADDLSTDVKEVEAFNSVHDMIHAAIDLRGGAATLQQIYTACQVRGRITHRRTGGSRLITQNENWKCQIRHALYTAPRFKRCRRNNEYWTVGEPFAHHGYQTTTVVVAANEGFVTMPQNPCRSHQVNSRDGTRSPSGLHHERSNGTSTRLSPSGGRRSHSWSIRSSFSRNYVRRFADLDPDARSIFSRCPVLGVMIPRKPRSIRRTYILQHEDPLVMSDPESESPPKTAVMRENRQPFPDIRDLISNKSRSRFKCQGFRERHEQRSQSPQTASACDNTGEGCGFLLRDFGGEFHWREGASRRLQERCANRGNIAYGDILRKPIFATLGATRDNPPETAPIKALSFGFNLSLSSHDGDLSTSTSSDEPPCTSETARISSRRKGLVTATRIARALRERG